MYKFKKICFWALLILGLAANGGRLYGLVVDCQNDGRLLLEPGTGSEQPLARGIGLQLAPTDKKGFGNLGESWSQAQKLAPLSKQCLQLALAAVAEQDQAFLSNFFVELMHIYLGAQGGISDDVSFVFGDTTQLGSSNPAFTVENEEVSGCQIIFINLQTFANAVKYGIYTDAELSAAILITLFHEITHVWQRCNLSAHKETLEEGHALFMQAIFAYDNDLELIHIKGVRSFSDRALLAKIYATNQLRAWLIKRNVQRVYFETFNSLFLIYEQSTIEGRFNRLRDVVDQFFEKS